MIRWPCLRRQSIKPGRIMLSILRLNILDRQLSWSVGWSHKWLKMVRLSLKQGWLHVVLRKIQKAIVTIARSVARGFEENTEGLWKDSPTCSKGAVRLPPFVSSRKVELPNRGCVLRTNLFCASVLKVLRSKFLLGRVVQFGLKYQYWTICVQRARLIWWSGFPLHISFHSVSLREGSLQIDEGADGVELK